MQLKKHNLEENRQKTMILKIERYFKKFAPAINQDFIPNLSKTYKYWLSLVFQEMPIS